MKTKIAYLALGSNVGDRNENLKAALERIAAFPGIELLAFTEAEETDPVGLVDQPKFLNQMAGIRTSLTPRLLLAACQQVENSGGRVRKGRWGPRTIDVDIVDMPGRRVDEPDLSIPHPEIENREFWKREMSDLGRRLSRELAE